MACKLPLAISVSKREPVWAALPSSPRCWIDRIRLWLGISSHQAWAGSSGSEHLVRGSAAAIGVCHPARRLINPSQLRASSRSLPRSRDSGTALHPYLSRLFPFVLAQQSGHDICVLNPATSVANADLLISVWAGSSGVCVWEKRWLVAVAVCRVLWLIAIRSMMKRCLLLCPRPADHSRHLYVQDVLLSDFCQ